jgi:hypothetical protein
MRNLTTITSILDSPVDIESEETAQVLSDELVISIKVSSSHHYKGLLKLVIWTARMLYKTCRPFGVAATHVRSTVTGLYIARYPGSANAQYWYHQHWHGADNPDSESDHLQEIDKVGKYISDELGKKDATNF